MDKKMERHEPVSEGSAHAVHGPAGSTALVRSAQGHLLRQLSAEWQ